MSAEFFMNVDTMSKKQLRAFAAQWLQYNAEAESEAQDKYSNLLYILDRLGDRDNIDKIREIQGDEKNHLLVIQAMLKDYDGNIKIASDGAEEALRELEINIE